MTKGEIAAIVFSIAVAVALILFLDAVHPDRPTACYDGWSSPSIGRQGACSHHGGVREGGDTTPGYLLWIPFAAGFATLCGLAVWFKLFKVEARTSVDPMLTVIMAAIESKGRIRFRYQKKGNEAAEVRELSPKIVKFLVPGRSSTRCVVGHCHKANEERTFALSRMSNVTRV